MSSGTVYKLYKNLNDPECIVFPSYDRYIEYFTSVLLPMGLCTGYLYSEYDKGKQQATVSLYIQRRK